MTSPSYFAEKSLLAPPVKRAAYSDRTAWLMAELSRLAYERFEGSASMQDLAKSLSALTASDDIQKRIEAWLDAYGAGGSDDGKNHGLRKELRRDINLSRSQRATNADFTRPLSDRCQHDVHDANPTHHERHRGDQSHEHHEHQSRCAGLLEQLQRNNDHIIFFVV